MNFPKAKILDFDNTSPFKEVVFLNLDEGIGTTNIERIELEPHSTRKVNLNINLNQDLNNGIHNFKLIFQALNKLSNINNKELEYKIEIVSFVENLKKNINSMPSIYIILSIILLALPIFIYIIGIFLYLILVKSQLRVKGLLVYSGEVNLEENLELDLAKKKKKFLVIAFNEHEEADFNIEGSPFNYSMKISTELTSKKKLFILGWIALLKKKTYVVQILSCTPPGILTYEEDVLTSIVLYGDEIFSSGGFDFHFIKPKSKWFMDQKEGQDILEGRV